MDIGMIVLAILNLCGVVSGTVVSIYSIVFACVIVIATLLKDRG